MVQKGSMACTRSYTGSASEPCLGTWFLGPALGLGSFGFFGCYKIIDLAGHN